jgi:hypothetical protein
LLDQLSPEDAAAGLRGLAILARAADALVAQKTKGGAARGRGLSTATRRRRG